MHYTDLLTSLNLAPGPFVSVTDDNRVVVGINDMGGCYPRLVQAEGNRAFKTLGDLDTGSCVRITCLLTQEEARTLLRGLQEVVAPQIVKGDAE